VPTQGPLAFVWGDAGGTPIDVITDPTTNNPHVLEWQNVTVPAGETYIFMAFLTVEADAAAALAAGMDLADLTDFAQFDGLTSADLAQIQNWAFTDTDNDGMPDFFENNFGLDPNDPSDAALDGDSDGLTNLEEWQNFTDPTNADSDNDGLSDGDEVNTHGTDPRDTDTDGDSLSDGGEVAVGLDPLDPADGPALRNISDGIENSFQPSAANDAAGNTHVVWTHDPVGLLNDSDFEIYYKLLDPDGAVLIDQTRLTNDAVGSEVQDVRPFVAVGSSGAPFVVWQRQFNDQVNLVVLDPSTDDQNGDAADPLTLIAVGPIELTDINLNNRKHTRAAVDGTGNVHIVAESDCSSELAYYQFAPDGTEVVPETLFDMEGSCHSTPDVATDSAGNVHIVWTDDEFTTDEVLYYQMLDNAGNTLIATTQLTVDNNERAKHATISIDGQDMAHIVWGDGRLHANMDEGVGGEIFYMKLDPSLDDQSGDAADPAVIKVIDDTLISADDSVHSWYVQSTLGADGNLHVTWVDSGARDNAGSGLFHMSLDTDGNIASTATEITGSPNGDTGNQYGPFATGGDAAFWTEQNSSDILQIVGLRLVAAGAVDAATGTGPVTVSIDQGLLTEVTPLALTDLPAEAQADVPTDATFDDGFFRIIISGVPVGGTVNVTLDLPGTYVAGTDSYDKWDANNGWQDFPYTNGATTNQVILALTDGGAGDADGVANGQIVDPGGPGVAAAAPPGGGNQLPAVNNPSDGCSLGSADAPVDPTLPILLLIALLYLTRRSWIRIRLF